jgi:tritrans,polycis-undecaprenyl-diphosphate synthase [geranylgeranyl-diphosphate specific]
MLLAARRSLPPSEIRKALTDATYRAYEKRLLKEVKGGPIPQHVAVIMDGNRRFAESLGLVHTAGHERGRDTLEELLDWCLDLGIHVLTVYAFSTENLSRSKEEVDELMRLFEVNFRKAAEDERVHRHRIRLKAFGQIEMLPKGVQDAIRYAEERTASYDGYRFNIAIAYGGREEILQAIRALAQEAMDGKVAPKDITEEVFSKHLYTYGLPDPDLILRTSGEARISNFLLWQLAYSELYFSDVYWPGFRKVDFLRAIRAYQQRHRRYGK